MKKESKKKNIKVNEEKSKRYNLKSLRNAKKAQYYREFWCICWCNSCAFVGSDAKKKANRF